VTEPTLVIKGAFCVYLCERACCHYEEDSMIKVEKSFTALCNAVIGRRGRLLLPCLHFPASALIDNTFFWHL